jgi:hypothetical protein
VVYLDCDGILLETRPISLEQHGTLAKLAAEMGSGSISVVSGGSQQRRNRSGLIDARLSFRRVAMIGGFNNTCPLLLSFHIIIEIIFVVPFDRCDFHCAEFRGGSGRSCSCGVIVLAETAEAGESGTPDEKAETMSSAVATSIPLPFR